MPIETQTAALIAILSIVAATFLSSFMIALNAQRKIAHALQRAILFSLLNIFIFTLFFATLYSVSESIGWNIILGFVIFMIAVVSGCTWSYLRARPSHFRKNPFSLHRTEPETLRSADAGPSREEPQDLVRAFSALAETLGPAEIRDAGELPYPKEEIRDAFRDAIVLAVNGGEDDRIEELGTTMSVLAQFQPDVGAALRDPVAAIAAAPDLETGDGYMKAAARRYSRAFESDEYKRYLEFWPSVEREAEALLTEARAFGRPESA